jgi:uncharacterized protein YmfQ (DUF2313 family)
VSRQLKHEDALKSLTPLPLGKDHDVALAVKGKHLDEAMALIDQLLDEMFPDTANELISDWEDLYAIVPNQDDPLPLRRDRVKAAINKTGLLGKPQLIALAKALGHEITIENYFPFVAGHAVAGDELLTEDAVWVWTVRGVSQDGYAFIAGEAQAGDRLGSFSSSIEALFNKLKNEHTKVVFVYDY